MTSKGEIAANWIIGKITEYASVTNEPFSERDLQLLRFSVGDFKESDRDEFLRLDAKTVRIIRATIADRKMTGIKCVKARKNFFIPPKWKINYLELYESDVSWMITHCAQTAMLSEPEQGEREFWRSPQITTGIRPSVTSVAPKPLDSSDVSRDEFKLSSAEEFNLLHSALVEFYTMVKFLFSLKALANHALGNEQENKEDFYKAGRMHALEIAVSISDLDDEVSASFFAYIGSEDVYDADIDQRQKLRSLCDPACQTVFSKSKLSKIFDSAEGAGLKPSLFYLSSVLELDQMCGMLTLPTFATKLYAGKALNLAAAVRRSSVFSSDPTKFGEQLLTFASVLKKSVEVSSLPQLDSMSIEQVSAEISRDLPKQPSWLILREMMKMESDVTSGLSEWNEKFTERCKHVYEFGLSPTADDESQFGKISADELKTQLRESFHQYLEALKHQYEEGQISLDDLNKKIEEVEKKIRSALS